MYNAGGCDYDAGPYSVTIPAGEIESSFNAIIYDDDVYESDETFQLVIDRRRLPSRITHVFPYRSTVTILNDEERKCFLYNTVYSNTSVNLQYSCDIIHKYLHPKTTFTNITM